MALAHSGTHPEDSPRLRVLLCLCELLESGVAGTYREVQHRLGMSPGSVSWHIRALEAEGLITRGGQARTLALTAAAFAELIRDGWLVPARQVVSYQLSERAVELLELAPKGGITP